jgi:hydrogenase nickel incorporation protein HypB
MCTVCGCGEVAHHNHRHDHDHDHDHDHGHDHNHDHHHAEADGSGQSRLVRIEQDILAYNAGFAARNRALFAERHMLVVNLMSSPGSGKTTLLCRTAEELKGRMPIAVIEGDQQTSFDADRIRAVGVPALQVNTGKGCHLDAHMIEHAVGTLDPADGTLLFVENVGNLVCPAGFDLGEAAKVVILSVTEGDDKPLKYPDMFAAAQLVILNKIDLLPYVSFDVDRCVQFARRVNRDIRMLEVSATSGQGLDTWYAWLDDKRR